MSNLDSFERMASGLTNDERQNILERLTSATPSREAESFSPVDEGIEESNLSFDEQIKKESVLLRFMLWIKSIFTSSRMDILYNEHKVSNIAKNLEKNFPGLVDSKRGLLLVTFYNKLSELQSAAAFLKPYLSAFEDDEGAFYVLLASLVMPEVTASMNSEVDPYSNPVTSTSRPELRIELLHKMDAIFENIHMSDKAKMYEAVKTTEWLRQFVKLPFSRFLNNFSNAAEDIYSCQYSHLGDEITTFSRILCSSFTITDELLQALYLFSVKRAKSSASSESENEASQFLSKAHSSISLLHMFMSSVPMKSLGCIIYSDSQWRPEPFAGGEDWFVKYKNSWKKIFEQKWGAWVKDCQKESLKINLRNNFGLEDFPPYPERPWANLWGGVYFRYELTGGFISWFLTKSFPDYEIALKTLLVEGNFNNKENLVAFTDAFNTIIQLSISVQGLVRKCESKGEIGIILAKLGEEHLRTLKAQTKVEQLVRSVESDLESILHKFGDAARTLTQILNGVLGIVKDTRFDTVSNLNRLQDKNNEAFQKKLHEAKSALENSLTLLLELENLDTQKSRY